MKKGLIITGIALGVLLLLLITLPFFFQGKIKEVIKTQANEMLNARLEFKDLSLSLIRNFPNATVSLEEMSLSGVDEFESDTLVYAGRLSATINLASLFGDSGYELKKIDVENTSVYAKVLENGKVNWDIMKETGEETDEAETSSDFSLQLQKINVNNVNIVYEDLQSKMKAVVTNFSGTMKGDMTADITNIETVSSINELTFIMDNIPFLNKVKLSTDLVLEANLKEQKYTLKKSSFDLNAIHAVLDGWVSMPDTTTIDMDLKAEAPEVQFKDLLSLIPAIYAADFKDLKAEGNVKFYATAKGKMQGESYPAFDMLLDVANGRFQYPALPKSLDDIQVNMNIQSPGGDLDNMLVDISNFHFNLGGNPFNLRLKVAHPMTDPNLALTANGKLNLGMIKDIYPLDEGMELTGILDADMSFSGVMSAIEKGAYEQFQAAGKLGIQDMILKSNEMSDVVIDAAAFSFNPRYAELSKADVKIGKNDLSATGRLENYLPYFMKDQTLKGNLNISSTYLNLNDFMSDETVVAEETGEETPLLAFEIPKNLDFSLAANLNEVIYEKIEMKNMTGNILVRGGKVDLKNLSMNALGGNMKVNGYYSTAENPKQPDVNFGLDLKNVSYAETFKAFGFVQKLAPIFENMLGTYSVNFDIKTSLTENMMPILTNLVGSGTLLSNDVTISDVPALTAMATALKNDNLKKISAKDIKIPFNIEDGRVNTKPFDINMGGTKMNLSGSTGLDQSIDYVVKVSLPSGLTNGMLSSVGVKIGGTFSSPKVSLDTQSLLEGAASSALDKLGLKGLSDSEGNVDLKGAANAEIEKQVEALRNQAKEAGKKLVSEAEKQGQNLIDEANKTKNPLAKAAAVAAAKSAANKLKEEAQKQADKLESDAEKKGTELSSSDQE